MQVSLFVTCLVDHLFPGVGLSAVRVLKDLGVEVRFDRRQTCCGQPAFNAGYWEEAAKVADSLLEIYSGEDWIVVPSGSCAAMIRHSLPRLFDTDPLRGAKARRIAERTREFSEFIVDELGVVSVGARFPGTVTYHDSCHLLRELGVSDQPRKLIQNVGEITFKEMRNSDRCCGFGGTFSVKFPEVSGALGSDKLNAIAETGAEYVVACDVSCLMHLQAILKQSGSGVKVLHIAELLAQRDAGEPAPGGRDT